MADRRRRGRASATTARLSAATRPRPARDAARPRRRWRALRRASAICAVAQNLPASPWWHFAPEFRIQFSLYDFGARGKRIGVRSSVAFADVVADANAREDQVHQRIADTTTHGISMR